MLINNIIETSKYSEKFAAEWFEKLKNFGDRQFSK
jgi:hypothetical protein